MTASALSLRDIEQYRLQRNQGRRRTWMVTPDLVCIAAQDGYFIDVNPAWTATLGWSEAELKSRPFSTFVHPDDIESTQAAFELLSHGDPVLRFENRYACRDGSYRWLSWVSVPEGDQFHCTARDVTREKAAEEERARLWALSEDMLARADYQGNLTAVNPAWTAVLGYTAHRLLRQPYADIIHPDDVPTTAAALQSMRQTGQPTRFENNIRAVTGEWKPIGWTVSPEPDGVHFIAIGRNLADYKAREKQLREAQEALRQSQKMEAVAN